MKSFLYQIVIVLGVIMSPTNLISQWSNIASDDFPGGRVDDLFFLDEQNGFWCTGGGQIFKTTDGVSATMVLWENVYFRSIEFLDENIGFAGTLDDAMYKTIDAGETWNIIDLGFTAPGICGMHAINDQVLWASGAWFEPAYLIKTSDAGETWEYIDMSNLANSLVDIHFVNDNVGFVTGYNDDGVLILKTIDGGLTWNNVYNSEGYGFVWKIDDLFNDPNIIYASLEIFNEALPDMVISYDQGETWVERLAPNLNHQGIGFVTENRGWIGGHEFETFETTDGGETWEAIPLVSGLNRMFIVDSETVFAGGNGMYYYSDSAVSVSEIYRPEVDEPLTNFYPNPASNFINYSIKIDKTDNLTVVLTDASGRMLRQLKNDRLTPGTHEFTFNLDEISSGQYFLVTHLNGSFRTDKIALQK